MALPSPAPVPQHLFMPCHQHLQARQYAICYNLVRQRLQGWWWCLCGHGFCDCTTVFSPLGLVFLTDLRKKACLGLPLAVFAFFGRSFPRCWCIEGICLPQPQPLFMPCLPQPPAPAPLHAVPSPAPAPLHAVLPAPSSQAIRHLFWLARACRDHGGGDCKAMAFVIVRLFFNPLGLVFFDGFAQKNVPWLAAYGLRVFRRGIPHWVQHRQIGWLEFPRQSAKWFATSVP